MHEGGVTSPLVLRRGKKNQINCLNVNIVLTQYFRNGLWGGFAKVHRDCENRQSAEDKNLMNGS